MKKIFAITCVLSALFLTALGQDYQTQIDLFRTDYIKNLSIESLPLKKEDLKDVHFYDADTTYNVLTLVEFFMNPKPVMLPSSSGPDQPYIEYAMLFFKINGRLFHLTLYKSTAPAPDPNFKENILLAFNDLTNDQTTNTQGRLIEVSEADFHGNRLNIDFNKAHNPISVYNSAYHCPLPPKENNLDTPIEAGEKKYTGKRRHK